MSGINWRTPSAQEVLMVSLITAATAMSGCGNKKGGEPLQNAGLPTEQVTDVTKPKGAAADGDKHYIDNHPDNMAEGGPR